MKRMLLSKVPGILLLAALPLASWAWSECQTQQQISRGHWQAVIQTQSVGAGCSIMDVHVAMGLRHESPMRLILRNSDPVVEMEFTDLDGNRQPELMLITQNVGSGSYGGATLVIQADQELQPIALPNVDAQTNPGYRGHDRIFAYRDVLVREYHVFAEKDPNCCPSGGFRELVYRFDGKAFVLQQ